MHLIGIMLSLVLSSIAVLQQASISAQLLKRDRNEQLMLEWFELQMETIQLISRLPDCSNALVGSVIGIDSTNQPTPSEVTFKSLQAGHLYQDLLLKHVQFIPVDTTNPLQWSGNIYVEAKKTGNYIGAPVIHHSFPLTVAVASNVITGCL